MTDFSWSDLAVVSAFSLLAVAVVLTVTAVVGFRIGRHNVVDVSWGQASSRWRSPRHWPGLATGGGEC